MKDFWYKQEDCRLDMRNFEKDYSVKSVREILSDLQKEKERFRRSETWRRHVLDAATQFAIIATSPEGVITIFNSGAEKMLGYSALEVIGKLRLEDLHVEDELLSYGRELSREFGYEIRGFAVLTIKPQCEGYEEREWTYVRKDGSHLPVNLIVTVVRSDAGEIIGFLSVAQDISRRKKAEQRQIELQEELLRSEKQLTLGRLAAGMAHEINNPAAAIKSDLSMLWKLVSALPESPQKQKMLNIIERDREAISRIESIVIAVKGAYRPEQWHFVDINKEIDLQLTILHRLYKGRIEIVKQYDNLPQIKVYGSEIGQAILNLLTNAIEAIEDEGRITITTKNMLDKITIDIADTGTGISEDILPHIFESFYTTKGKSKGTGLGLSMSAQIARRHKGRLYISKNIVGRGATFTLEISKDAENG